MIPKKCKHCEYKDYDDDHGYFCAAPKDEDGKRSCEIKRE